ncbi:MAG: hypothetical protein AAGB34_03730, partial [Planctomycetota bacterium]
ALDLDRSRLDLSRDSLDQQRELTLKQMAAQEEAQRRSMRQSAYQFARREDMDIRRMMMDQVNAEMGRDFRRERDQFDADQWMNRAEFSGNQQRDMAQYMADLERQEIEQRMRFEDQRFETRSDRAMEDWFAKQAYLEEARDTEYTEQQKREIEQYDQQIKRIHDRGDLNADEKDYAIRQALNRRDGVRPKPKENPFPEGQGVGEVWELPDIGYLTRGQDGTPKLIAKSPPKEVYQPPDVSQMNRLRNDAMDVVGRKIDRGYVNPSTEADYDRLVDSEIDRMVNRHRDSWMQAYEPERHQRDNVLQQVEQMGVDPEILATLEQVLSDEQRIALQQEAIAELQRRGVDYHGRPDVLLEQMYLIFQEEQQLATTQRQVPYGRFQ